MANDVLAYFREKDPRFKDISDVALRSYIKDRYPEFLKHPTFATSATPFQKQAAANKLSIEAESGREKENQNVRDVHGQMATLAATAIPMAVAAPFTGGTSLGPALAMGAAAGAAGGAMGMGARVMAGSSETPKSLKDVAQTLAWDAGFGMAGEGFGRLGTKVLAEAFPAVLKRAAATTNDGKQALTRLYANIRLSTTDTLRQAGDPVVNVGREITALESRLKALPQGPKGWTDKMKDTLGQIKNELKVDPATGFVSSEQKLVDLIERKGIVSQVAHGDGVTPQEGKILADFVAQIDAKIKGGIAALPGKAKAQVRELYDSGNAVMRVQKENDLAVGLMEKALHSSKGVIGRVMTGASIGGAAGYTYRGAPGASTGAAIGATAALAGPMAATWAVNVIAKHPACAATLKKAVTLASQGKGAQAEVLAARAAGMAGVREMLREKAQSEGLLETHPSGDEGRK